MRVFKDNVNQADWYLAWLCKAHRGIRSFKDNFNQADWYLFSFSMADFGYVTYLSEFLGLQPPNVLVFVLSLLVLALFSLLFTSIYRRKCSTLAKNKHRRRDGIDATLWLFLVSASTLLSPLSFRPMNFSFFFQIIFPFVVSTFVAWAAYLDGRLLHNASENGTDSYLYLDLKLKFLQMIIKPIASLYVVMVFTVVLGIDKIALIMGHSTPIDMLSFAVGVVLIMGQLHYLITARLFLHCEEIMKELKEIGFTS